MILAAVGRAPVIGAVLDALVAPFLADEVGQRQAVLGHVGALVVTAQAAVGELFL